MLNKRQIQIISILAKSGRPMSNRELSRALNVSARTVSTDISVINQEVKNSGNRVETGGSGHYIAEGSRPFFYSLLSEQYKDNDGGFPDTPSRRIYYILLQLLFLDDYVTMEQLADAMFFSKSTISYDIREIENYLENMKVSLCITPKGIYLAGSEEQKRELIGNILFDAYNRNSLQFVRNMLVQIGILDADKLMRLYQFFIESFAEMQISLTDRGIQIFSLQNALDYFRITQLHTVDDPGSQIAVTPFDYEKIEEIFQVELSEAERKYMTVLLSVRRVTAYQDLNSDESADKIIDLFYKGLKENYHIDTDALEIYRESLSSHLTAMLRRAHNRLSSDRQMTERIRRSYPYAFECATSILPIIQNQLGITASEEEVAYIAVYIAMILDAVSEKAGIIILCGSGMGLAQLIRRRIENHFGGRVEIRGTFSVYQLNQALRQNPDISLIVTTVPVPRSCTVPSVVVSPLFEKEDIEKLEQSLNIQRSRSFQTNTGNQIRELFRPELFFVKSGAIRRHDLIREMAGELEKLGYISDPDEFSASVWEREAVHSTLYEGIWLPHPLKSMSSGSVFAVGILPDETEYRIVFLMALRSEDIDRYRVFYDKVTRMMDNRDLLEKVRRSRDLDEFAGIMETL